MFVVAMLLIPRLKQQNEPRAPQTAKLATGSKPNPPPISILEVS